MSALRKVLVVDDDPVVATSYDRVLSSKGYAVITAHDAAEALEQLRREQVDLVVTDIKMPGMDGLELAETLHARRPWTPVVIITGYGSQDDEARAKAAGVKSFIHKPLTPAMIQASADDALRVVPQVATALPTATPTAVAAPAQAPESRLRNVVLFFAAPFIGLVYAVFLPFVGLGMIAWFAGQALVRSGALRRIGAGALTVGKILLAPFVGLAYIVVLPFAGLAALAWFAGRAAFQPRRTE